MPEKPTQEALPSLLPKKSIINKIYFLRGKKVMFDRDLAELYGVKTKVLKQSVKRNIKDFQSIPGLFLAHI